MCLAYLAQRQPSCWPPLPQNCTAPAPLHIRPCAELPDVRTSSPVQSVRSLGPQGPVQLTVAGASEAEEFDAVLLSTHSNISLKMLGAQGPKV